jgi:uncharacterized membrane protein
MPKIKLVIALIALVGVVIIGEAIFAFTRPDGLQTSQGLILIGIAVAALIVVSVVLVYIWRSLKAGAKNSTKPDK